MLFGYNIRGGIVSIAVERQLHGVRRQCIHQSRSMHIPANQDAEMCIDFELENSVDYLGSAKLSGPFRPILP